MGKSKYICQSKAILLCTLLMGVFFLSTLCISAQAIVFPSGNDSEFLNWYNENKDTDHAVYTLQNDLRLRSGTADSPILLDGLGHVTIDCGPNTLLINSDVVIDNPNLTIKGENIFVVLVNNQCTLALKRGAICLEGESGSAVAFTSGNGTLAVPEGGSRFTVTARGRDVTGLYYFGSPDVTISNLDIQIQGTEISKGINIYTQEARIKNCTVMSSGSSQVFGIAANGNIDITGSHITALGTDAGTELHSVYSFQDNSLVYRDEASVLIPPLPGSTVIQKTYIIREYLPDTPCTLAAGAGFSAGDFPSDVRVAVEEQSSGEWSERSFPVRWNLSGLDTSDPGVYTVPGTFAPDTEACDYINPQQITPYLSVICTKENQIFLAGWDAFWYNVSKTRLHLLMPFPYGADRVILQYSTDGETFFAYQAKGQENLLTPTDRPYPDGLWGFAVSLPANAPRLYVRTVISGGSIYDGTSPIWELDITSGGGSMPPEYEHGDGGGDRGGQTIDPKDPEVSVSPAGDNPGSAVTYEALSPLTPNSLHNDTASAPENESLPADTVDGLPESPDAAAVSAGAAKTPEDLDSSEKIPVYAAASDKENSVRPEAAVDRTSRFPVYARLLLAAIFLCVFMIVRKISKSTAERNHNAEK